MDGHVSREVYKHNSTPNSSKGMLAGHFGANESQIGDRKNFVPNGELGGQTLPIEVSICTSDGTLS